MSKGRFVEVAVPLPVDETYDYALAAGDQTEPGSRVIVPYRGRRVTAVVVAVRDTPRPGRRAPVREVQAVLDGTPVLPPRLLAVILQAAEDTLSPPGVALTAAIPPGCPRKIQSVRLPFLGREWKAHLRRHRRRQRLIR